MKKGNLKRNIVLSILFFLPVVFLLMLYPAKHNYTPLDVVNTGVIELDGFSNVLKQDTIAFKNHITILGFLGQQPLDQVIAISNLKELVYDKFKGFKKFQVVIVAPLGSEKDIKTLHKEISTYEDMRFWHYVHGSEAAIQQVFLSLKSKQPLAPNLASNQMFIIDNHLNQRGRIDARTKKQIEANKPISTLTSYNCIEVDEIKNKMNDDIRILFTEYRQKRKGKFDSSSRRNNDLKSTTNE